jgi:hypothetical protein
MLAYYLGQAAAMGATNGLQICSRLFVSVRVGRVIVQMCS